MKKIASKLLINNPLVLASIFLGLILAFALITSTSIFSHTKLILARDEITVKGVAHRDVEADRGTWNIKLEVIAPTGSLSLKQMEAQQKLINDHLLQFENFTIKKGIPKTIESIEWIEGEKISHGYRSQISFKITSDDVNSLYDQAVVFNTFAVENELGIVTNSTDFYYSKLNSLKIELLKQAVDDAKFRAEAIGSRSDTRIGKVKKASQGVFQVNERSNFGVSAGGNFDTESVDKTVRATISITFELL